MLPTTTQITQALKQNQVLSTGSVRSFRVLETFQAHADLLVRLELSYSHVETSAPATVVCKVFGGDWYHGNGLTELLFYRDLAPQTPNVPLADFYGYIDDPAQEYRVLFIEDLQFSYHPIKLPLSNSSLNLLTDTLVALHGNWWEHESLNQARFLIPEEAVTRMPQALKPAELAINATLANQALNRFQDKHYAKLSGYELSLIAGLKQFWHPLFKERIHQDQALTLIHGDFHLLGNILMSRSSNEPQSLKVIDWAQVKRGLGVHDLMYVLLSIESPDRVTRDRRLIERYYQGLIDAGIKHYSWDQCLWDYQFSLLTNTFQSVFQDSLNWFKKTVGIIEIWEAERLLK